jgi:hypothetical protein
LSAFFRFTASDYPFDIFWLPLWYLLITSLISSDYPFGIFWLPPWYLLITPLVSSNLTWCHCHKNSTFDITRWVNFTKYLHFTKIYFYHLSPTRLLRTCQWITCLLCYKQQEMFTFCEHLSSHHLIDDVHVFSAFCEHLSSHHLIDDVHVLSAFCEHLSSHHLIDDVHVFSAFRKHLSSHHLIDDVHVFSAFCEHLSSHLIDDVHVFLPFVSTWVHILLMMSMHSYLL